MLYRLWTLALALTNIRAGPAQTRVCKSGKTIHWSLLLSPWNTIPLTSPNISHRRACQCPPPPKFSDCELHFKSCRGPSHLPNICCQWKCRTLGVLSGSILTHKIATSQHAFLHQPYNFPFYLTWVMCAHILEGEKFSWTTNIELNYFYYNVT